MKTILTLTFCRVVMGAVVFATAVMNIAFALDWQNLDSWKTVTVDEVRAWIKAGANLGARDEVDRTPLHLAAGYSEDPAVISTLLEAGADVGAKDGDGGRIPLHLAAGYNENPAVLSVLLEAGSDVDAKTESGWTPLHIAAQWGRIAVISALIKAGADVHAKTDYGSTPLHSSVTLFHENSAAISALVAYGADLNSKNNAGLTPLDLASRLGKPLIVEYLSNPAQVKRDAEEYLSSTEE